MTEFFAGLLRYKKTIPLISGIVVLALASGIFRLKITHDHTSFFSKSNKRLNQLEKLQDQYGYSGNLLFCIVPDSGTVYSLPVLKCMETVTSQAENLPRASFVQSLVNYKKPVMGIGGLQVQNLIDLSRADRAGYLDSMQSIIESDPSAVNRLVSESGHAAGIVVYFDIPDSVSPPTQKIAGAARAMIDSLSAAYPDMRFYGTGGLMLDEAFAEASYRDISVLLPLMYFIMTAALWFIIADLYALLAVILVVVGSTLAAMGVAGWLGIVLTPPSSIAPIILLTVGIADSIHIVISFFHHYRPDTGRNSAVVEALGRNFMPVLITSLTTLVGFAGLNFSNVPPFRHLGTIVGAGIAAAFVLTVTLLPSLLLQFPIPVRGPRRGRHDFIGTRLGAAITKHPKTFAVATALAAIICITGLRHIELNDMFIDYFDHSFAFRRHTDAIIENLTGLDYIECSFAAQKGGLITDSSYLSFIDRFCTWARTRGGVVHVAGISDILKVINFRLHRGRKEHYRIGSPALTQAILEGSGGSTARSAGMSLLVNDSATATRVFITVGKISAKELRSLEKAVNAWIDVNSPGTVSATIGSISLMFAHISELNIKSMIRGIAVSLLAIFIALSILGKKLRWGFIGLFPNIVTLLMAIGLWGIITGQAGLAISIVAAMSLGIIVDDTIHLLYTFMTACSRKRLGPDDGVRYSLRHTADAIVFTSAILAAGFGILSFSGFRPTAHMGVLTTIILVFALAADLFLFSPLLMLLRCENGR
ncbi:MAG: MMPL family transporter [Chitinivibrionales bacterium]|nr:MMPL family transporter [Chitinivibrionales bacterium]